MKKNKNQNLSIDQIENQINSTLDALYSKKILYTYNYIYKEGNNSNNQYLTWKNHESGKFNTGSYFLKLEQYRKILENNSYLCILYDGSIIRVSYTFENNVLVGHNLLWWPAPYSYKNITLEDIPPQDLFEEFIADSKWMEAIKMRSPVRFDFDPSKNAVNEKHSPIHLHMQHEDCRMYIEKPLCFNEFINFILKNYYPDVIFNIDKYDYIDFETPNNWSFVNFENSKITL